MLFPDACCELKKHQNLPRPRLFGKYPAMGVALYRWSVMA